MNWKRHFSSTVGGAICGAACFAVWPELWKSYGIMGGFMAATIIISIMWYFNHWLGVIENPAGKIWVDQGFAISAAGIVWGIVRLDAAFLQSIPTFVCCAIGGVLAAAAAVVVKQVLPRYNSGTNKS